VSMMAPRREANPENLKRPREYTPTFCCDIGGQTEHGPRGKHHLRLDLCAEQAPDQVRQGCGPNPKLRITNMVVRDHPDGQTPLAHIVRAPHRRLVEMGGNKTIQGQGEHTDGRMCVVLLW